ncbi:MAG: hypothetical protein EPO02_13220 [Nitrospirae bacterium]|nr:MAG: hypothetical protein EPO02_13220 [Nitrospirota bacterium]
MSSVIKQFSLTDLSNLYRIAYGDFELDAAGWDHSELIGLIQKSSKFVGNRLELAQLVDWGGGQSSGSLPSSSTAYINRPFLNAMSVYATSVIDSQSMKAARRAGSNLGAFMDATELSILTMKRAFSDQVARQFFGDGTGTLGVISSVIVVSPGNYELLITNATWLEAPWMLNDLLNIATGTDLFLITNINLTTQVITVSRQSGIQVPAAGQGIYKQKSKDNEMFGLKGVTETVTGNLYGVPVGYRWGAQRLDGQGQTLSVKIMRELDQKMRFWARGDLPTDYIMSATQLRLFEDSEDAKSIIYIQPEVSPERQAGSQVAAVKINGRTIRIHWSPYVENDKLYAINRNKVHMYIRPDTADGNDPGGFIENGDSIFFALQVSGTPLDSYGIFYATYANFYINPTFTGLIFNLATS